MTAYTLVIIFYLGHTAGQNIVVPGFATENQCRAAAESLTPQWIRDRSIVRCLEILR